MASCPITSWQIEGKKVEVVTDFIFLVSKITVDVDCSHAIKRRLLLGRKNLCVLQETEALERCTEVLRRVSVCARGSLGHV